jgi:N-acetyl-anhydromuramyl-L-alanine amidase AmpD
MKASRIAAHENAFYTTGVDINGKSHKLTPFSVAIPGTSDRVQMVECTRANGDKSFYYEEETPKKRIVLHYTEGFLSSDIATLTTPNNHVSTPFVVARDGRIYNLWTSKYWSYHLGKAAEGGNEAMSRSSIGIEISNIGWLTRKGDELHTQYSSTKSPDVYCTVADTQLYTKIPAFREREYFATFTEAQYESVIKLVRFLAAKYDIPLKFVSPAKRFGVVSGIASFAGITSHVNFRPSGKWDIGPAFDWDRVIAGVTGAGVVAEPAMAAAPARAAKKVRAKKAAMDDAEVEDPSGPKTTRPDAAERRAPEAEHTASEVINRTLDAAPDRVDTRDWFYQPRLVPLPNRIINIDRVPEVLDQGTEGACTGFALAGVINFLLAQQGIARSVSRRMLYELARRYDEWPGEEYEGSSARGAMKAWVRHGVCEASHWGDAEHGLDCFQKVIDPTGGLTVADAARGTPGGAFYRVMHREVRDMHAALAETGALYCTLMVHKGWDSPGGLTQEYVAPDGTKLTLPVIQRQGRADGGHAVALVGYTEHGFIVQNSWGPGWGHNGFALLPYEDYLLHATDVWVMQLGVPVKADLWTTGGAADTTAGIQRANNIVSLDVIRPFVVDVGNNGELSSSGDYWTTEDDVRRLLHETVVKATKNWKKKRVMLYLHGGLNPERGVAQRIIAFRDVLIANEIYPIHIMWETGAMESLNSIIRDRITDVDERAAGPRAEWLRKVREGLLDAKDRTLELTVARAGGALWGEMKENAKLASEHPDGRGAIQILTRYARQLREAMGGKHDFEVHVVAHSAGSIFAAHALPHLAGLGEGFKSLQLLAPAIRIDEFRKLVLPKIHAKQCPVPSLYLLSDSGERDDNVGPYGRSLLYLVSNAFEGRRETPLLGMQRFVTEMEDTRGHIDPEISALFAGDDELKLPRLIVAGASYPVGANGALDFLSQSDSHGGFDNDARTLNTVLHRILGKKPEREFALRDLQY